jgi:hypothetical protein
VGGVSALVLLFRAVEWHIGQAGSLGNDGEVKQRRADIWEHWDGEFELAEHKKEWTGALRGAYGICPQTLRL